MEAFGQGPPTPLLRRNSSKLKTFDGLGTNTPLRGLVPSPTMSLSSNPGSLAVKGNAVAPSPTLGGMPIEYVKSPAIGGSFKSPGMSKLLKSPNMSASFDLGRPSPMPRPSGKIMLSPLQGRREGEGGKGKGGREGGRDDQKDKSERARERGSEGARDQGA